VGCKPYKKAGKFSPQPPPSPVLRVSETSLP